MCGGLKNTEIFPGDRVMVFDSALYIDDVKTPLSVTMKPATVVCRYGKVYQPPQIISEIPWTYPDLVDVQFDHRPKIISKGHFTRGVRKLDA